MKAIVSKILKTSFFQRVSFQVKRARDKLKGGKIKACADSRDITKDTLNFHTSASGVDAFREDLRV